MRHRLEQILGASWRARFRGLGFRGLGFSGLGFRGLEFRVEGLRAKASNLGIKPQQAPTSAEAVEDVAVSKPADSVDDWVTVRVIGSINLLKCPVTL